MIVGYLLNVYPRPNHSYIRRETAALEAEGVTVHRFALRPCADAVSPEDVAETKRTRFIVSAGIVILLLHTLREVLSNPRRAFSALSLAIKTGRRSHRGALLHIIYWSEACVLKHWLKEVGAQHLHAHFATNTCSIAMFANAMGGPSYSFTVHGPEEFDRPQEWSLCEKIARSSFVIAISEFGRSQLYRWCPHSQWKKIHIVRCGVDATFLSAPPTPVPAAPRLLSVGRLSAEKGQLILLEAAAALASRGVTFELLIAGGGDMESELQRYIDAHGLKDCVKLVGWKDNTAVRDLTLQSRALVMPSFAEGLPVVIMESLALQRPVISTYLAGIPELVEENISGFLVPAGSVEALVEKMNQVIAADPARLTEMGSIGAARVRRDHNAAIQGIRLKALFADTIAKQAASIASDTPGVDAPGLLAAKVESAQV
jgi:glycosyltransferase involved in cell wall biosynthesis